MSPTDEELVKNYLKGQKESFFELVNRYQNKTYNLAFRLTGNREDAADISQEIFIHLLGKISQFQGKSAFSTWYYRISINKIYDFLRKSKETLPINEEIIHQNNHTSEQLDPAVAYEKTELGEKIQSELNKLSEEFRTILILRDINDYSYQQISEILGVSMGTVKSRLSRARKAFVQQVKPIIGNKTAMTNIKKEET